MARCASSAAAPRPSSSGRRPRGHRRRRGLPVPEPVWVGFEQDRVGAAALTGFTTDEVRAVTGEILHDLVIGPPDFDATVAGTPVFNDRERAHCATCGRSSSPSARWRCWACSSLLNVRSVAPGAPDAPRLARRSAAGAVLLAGAVVIGGVIAAARLRAALRGLPRAVLPGGLYTFDPATDRLVQLFPIQFWEETSLAVGVVILVLSAAVASWGLRSPEAT